MVRGVQGIGSHARHRLEPTDEVPEEVANKAKKQFLYIAHSSPLKRRLHLRVRLRPAEIGALAGSALGALLLRDLLTPTAGGAIAAPSGRAPTRAAVLVPAGAR